MMKPLIEMSNKEVKKLIKHHQDCLNNLNIVTGRFKSLL